MSLSSHLVKSGSDKQSKNRVIALIDMDCFYVQVEQKAAPETRGNPCVVAQYRTYKGGGLIAIGYEARACGVKRGMMADEARILCDNLHVFRVPEVNGKANINKYREAGAAVIKVLSQFTNCVERASVDEAYIDLTDAVNERIATENVCGKQYKVDPTQLPNTHIVGAEQDRQQAVASWCSDLFTSGQQSHTDDMNRTEDIQLTIGAAIIEEIRAAVYQQLEFRCSAGIAHNKTLAKLACGIHKPNQQTMLPRNCVFILYNNVSISKVRGLGGKLGVTVMEELGIQTMKELSEVPLEVLKKRYGDKQGMWLYEVSHGTDEEPVVDRKLAKSIGCGRNFRGPEQLNTKEKVKSWITVLCQEVIERLTSDRENNQRTSKLLTIAVQQNDATVSFSVPIVAYDAQRLEANVYEKLSRYDQTSQHQPEWTPSITMLALSAGKFTTDDAGQSSIKSFFSAGSTPAATVQSVTSPSPPTPQTRSHTQPHSGGKRSASSDGLPSAKRIRSAKPLLPQRTETAEQSSRQLPANMFGMIMFKKKDTVDSWIENVSDVMNDINNKLCEQNTCDVEETTILLKQEQADDAVKDSYVNSSVASLDVAIKSPEKDTKLHISPTPTSSTASPSPAKKRQQQMSSCISSYLVPKSESSDATVIDRSTANAQLAVTPQTLFPSNTAEGGGCEPASVSHDDITSSSIATAVDMEAASADAHGGADHNDDDYVVCGRCSKQVLVWDYQVHTDQHYARDLQRQTNAQMEEERKARSKVQGKAQSKASKLAASPLMKYLKKK